MKWKDADPCLGYAIVCVGSANVCLIFKNGPHFSYFSIKDRKMIDQSDFFKVFTGKILQ